MRERKLRGRPGAPAQDWAVRPGRGGLPARKGRGSSQAANCKETLPPSCCPRTARAGEACAAGGGGRGRKDAGGLAVRRGARGPTLAEVMSRRCVPQAGGRAAGLPGRLRTATAATGAEPARLSWAAAGLVRGPRDPLARPPSAPQESCPEVPWLGDRAQPPTSEL